MIFLCRDNFITKNDCNKLIKFFSKNNKKHKKHLTKDKIFNKVLDLTNEKYFINNFSKILKDSNYISKLLNNSTFEYTHLVKWPINSYQPLHKDTAYQHTTLASILYLNDDYDGGETYFEDGSYFKPKEGRIIFFDGRYYKHGVKEVLKNPRYTIATWYKKIENNN